MRLVGGMALVLCAVAACYSPSPAVGLPCSASLDCPSGQTCQLGGPTGPTCVVMVSEIDAGDKVRVDAEVDAPLPIDAQAIDAVIIDGPPGGAPPNDLPQDAIDVAAGGTFAFDLSNASSEFTPACGTGTGPDVFFTLTLAAAEVVYLDTLGSSSGDPVVSIRAGDCTPIGTAEACVDNSCGGAQAQGAWNLAAGPHCIVIDQVGAGTAGTLRVVRGGRAGDQLTSPSGSVNGDTCNDDNSNNAICGCAGTEKDHHYFFTICPGTRTAMLDMCNSATNFDAILQLRDAANTSLECNDNDVCQGSETLSQVINGPGLFWAIVEGCADCGAYAMSYSF